MESIDDENYRKYFSPRRAKSKWSEKNIKLAEKLEAEGLMTEHGRQKIEEAKARGAFSAEKREPISDATVEILREQLKPYEKALSNFDAMPASQRRAYTGSYISIKTDEGRARRLAVLVERLELNLNPMASLAKKKAEAEQR